MFLASIRESGFVIGYKINIQQSVVFPYTGKNPLDTDRKENHSILYQWQKTLGLNQQEMSRT